MDALNSGLYPAAGDPSQFASTAPLAAGAKFVSPWLDISGSGDVSFFSVLVSSDQAGTLTVYNEEIQSDDSQAAVGGAVLRASPLLGVAGTPVFIGGQANARYLQFQYVNGPVAQLVFSIQLTMAANPAVTNAQNLLDTRRVLELMLRELRAQSLLLAALKEPGPLNLNSPFGPMPLGT